jgi:hypothetical protein
LPRTSLSIFRKLSLKLIYRLLILLCKSFYQDIPFEVVIAIIIAVLGLSIVNATSPNDYPATN